MAGYVPKSILEKLSSTEKKEGDIQLSLQGQSVGNGMTGKETSSKAPKKEPKTNANIRILFSYQK